MSVNDEIPKSRITLTYRSAVTGEPEDVVLPYRQLVMGDFSNGTSTDRKLDLDQRNLRNLDGTNLDQVMEDMKMTLTSRSRTRLIRPTAKSSTCRCPSRA